MLYKFFKGRDSDTRGQLNQRELEVIEFLLENQRVLPNHTVCYRFGNPTLLEYALYQGFFDAAELLIKYCADVDRNVAKIGVGPKTPDVTIREKISDAASGSRKEWAEHFIPLMEHIK